MIRFDRVQRSGVHRLISHEMMALTTMRAPRAARNVLSVTMSKIIGGSLLFFEGVESVSGEPQNAARTLPPAGPNQGRRRIYVEARL